MLTFELGWLEGRLRLLEQRAILASTLLSLALFIPANDQFPIVVT